MIKSILILLSLTTAMQNGCGQVNRSIDCSTCTTKDSVIVRKLEDMRFEKYNGKEVQAFLSDVKHEYADFVTITKKAGYIDRVMFGYGDSVTVEFSVSDLNQTKPLNFGYIFNIEEFKKKKISMICFRYGGRCIKGCKGEFCPE
jgi:hypothetical protein